MRSLVIAGVVALVSCTPLVDPRTVDDKKAFRLTVKDTVLNANGKASTEVGIQFDSVAKSGLKVTFQTDLGHFDGTGKSIDLAVDNRAAATRLVADTIGGFAVVSAAINGIRQTQTVELRPTKPDHFIVVPSKSTATADGADAVTITVSLVGSVAEPYVTRGQPVELSVYDALKVRVPEMSRLGVFSGAPVDLRLTSRLAGVLRVICTVAGVSSDTTFLTFKAPPSP